MRRFLIAAGTSTYREGSGLPSLPLAGEDAERLAAFLTTPAMGYTRVLEKVSTDPTAAEFEDALAEWSSGAGLTAEDVVLLYYAGHGDRPADRSYRLACADSRPGSPRSWLSLANIAEILADSPLRHVLFVIDACHAAAGAAEFQGVTDSIVAARPRGDAPGSGTWVLASARHRDLADDGAFAARLIEACERGDGPSQRHLAPSGLAARVNESFLAEGGRRQRATCSAAHQVEPPPFFPNPCHDPAAETHGDGTSGNTGDLRSHFEPRGRGVEHVHDPGSYFTGRANALTRLREHLAGPGGRGALAVTAAPGSGKSAVLGRLVLDGCSDVSVNARHQTLDALVARLAAAADITAADPPSLLRSLAARRAPFRIVVDSLDEAGPADDRTEAGRIAWELLRPLGGVECVRLVVGSRRELLPHLGERLATMDLDSAAYADDTSTAEYVRRVLADPPSPYTGRPAEAEAVATEVARRSGRCFLVARMTATALLRGEVVDTSIPGWADALPSDVGGAFDAYLRRLPPARRESAMALLATLAFGEGQGLPRRVWLGAARRLTGIDLREADIDALAEEDESYLTCLDSAGVKHFRLYHQELTDHLRRRLLRSRDLKDVQQAFVDVLLDLTPDRRWVDAPPYVRAHLATHAAGAETIGELIEDPAFLLAADPAGLLPAVRHPSVPPMAALVVERCADILGTAAPVGLDRAARLAFTAESLGVPALARRAEELSPSVRRVRVEARPVTPHRIVGRHEEGTNSTVMVAWAWRIRHVVLDDGSRAVLASHVGRSNVYVWMVDDARRSLVLPHPHAVVGFEVLTTRDGRVLAATLDSQGDLRLWDVADHSLVLHLPETPYQAIADVGRPDGGRPLLVCVDEERVVVLELRGETLLSVFSLTVGQDTDATFGACLVHDADGWARLVVCDERRGAVLGYAPEDGWREEVLLRDLRRPHLVRRTAWHTGAAWVALSELGDQERDEPGYSILLNCRTLRTIGMDGDGDPSDGEFVLRAPGDSVFVERANNVVRLYVLADDRRSTVEVPDLSGGDFTPFCWGSGVYTVDPDFSGGLRIVDCLTGRTAGPHLHGHESAVCGLHVLPAEGDHAPDILTVGNDGTARLWPSLHAEETEQTGAGIRDSSQQSTTVQLLGWSARPQDFVAASWSGLRLVDAGALERDGLADEPPLTSRFLARTISLMDATWEEDDDGTLHLLGLLKRPTRIDDRSSRPSRMCIGWQRLKTDGTVTFAEPDGAVPLSPGACGYLLPGTVLRPGAAATGYDPWEGLLLNGLSIDPPDKPHAPGMGFSTAFTDRAGRAVLLAGFRGEPPAEGAPDTGAAAPATGYLWDLDTGRRLRPTPWELPPGTDLLAAHHDPAGTRYVAMTCVDGGVAVLDLETDRVHIVSPGQPDNGHRADPMNLSIGNDLSIGHGRLLRWVRVGGQELLLCRVRTGRGEDPSGPVLLWDPAHPTTPARELPVQARRLLWSGQAPTGEALLAVSDEHGVRLVHLPSGEDVWSAPLPALVTSLALRPGSPHLDMGIATQQGVVLIRPRLTPAWRRRLLGDGA